MNVDVSLVVGTQTFAICMIIRDHKGGFIQAKTVRYTEEIPVSETEARGVMEAINLVHSLQLHDVDIEINFLLTVNGLQKITYYNNLDGRRDLAVYFFKRHANKCAHMIARALCMVNCHNIFMSPPLFLLKTILYDSSLN